MRDIKIARVDERLIHGQVVTAWLQNSNANTIVVADDESANNPLSESLFKLAIPKGISLKILSIEDTVNYIKSDGPEKIMLIIGNLDNVYRLLENGLKIEKINLGNINQHPSKKKYSKSIWLDDDDIQNIENIRNKDVELYVQVIPSERRTSIEELLK